MLGKADKEAVEDAKTNLAISTLNVLLADLKLAAVAAKAVESSKTLGFYADATLTRTGQKTNLNSSDNQEIGSNLIANGNINISSGLSLTNEQAQENRDLGNTNIKGILTSNNGDINIISANDTNITALKSTSSSSSKSEGFSSTITLASTASASSKAFEQAINSLTASIGAGTNSSKSDASSTSYANTQLTASNGNIKINSGNDANIKGVNILAENTILNTQNNLTIESLQNTANSKSKSKSINAGAGGNAGGLSSISLGYNSNKSSFERNWVDEQTTIIGTNSVVINTGNNTHNKGALIANITNAVSNPPLEGGSQSLAMRGGVNYIGSELIDGNNLTINTGTLTFENIYDSETQKSSGFGVNLSNISVSGNTTSSSDSTSSNIVQETNYYPKGSTTLSLQNQGYTKEQTTKATVGGGNITIGSTQVFKTDATSNDYGNLVSSSGGKNINDIINNPSPNQASPSSTLPQGESNSLADLNRDIKSSQEITKNTITGALDVSATIDNRILAAGYEILTNQEEKIQNDPTLTNKEKEQRIAALNGNVLKNEFLNQGGNLVVNNTTLLTTTKDIITSFADIDSNDPKNSNYLKALSNNLNLRQNSIFNTQTLLKESENAKYYNDPNDGNDGYHNPKTGEIFINLARAGETTEQRNQFITDLSLHEGAHKDADYNNISKENEETLVRNYQNKASGFINFYHNQGGYSDNLFSDLVSWGYNNSSVSDGYNISNSYVSNVYNNATRNITESSIANNNILARNVDKSEIEPALYINKTTKQVIASDQKNDHKIILITDKETSELQAKYNALKLNLPQTTILLNDFAETNILNKDAEIIKLSTSYQTQTDGEIYDLTKINDFKYLANLTGEFGVTYSPEVYSLLFNQQNNNDMTRIFFQNGMQNNYDSALASAKLISDLTNQEVGLIVNSTGKTLNDISEYLPNHLYLKDALNGEVYQQIATKTKEPTLIIMHSAGNEDARKSAEILKLSNVNLNNQINFISVGSPVYKTQLQQSFEPIGGNLLGQYNNWKDPVTNSKTWVVGATSLLVAGGYVGGSIGAGATTAGTGLESIFTGLIGGGIGGGIGYTNLKFQHPFENYFNKDFKNLKTDIKTWSVNNNDNN